MLSPVASTPALYLSHQTDQRLAYAFDFSCFIASDSLLCLDQLKYILLKWMTNQSLLFLLTINTTDPIYYYCGQIGHCQKGMVGVINPPCDGSKNFVDYQSAAKLVTSVGPLPSVVRGGQFVSTYPSGTPTAPPVAGPSFTGFSASCTVGSNTTSNTTTSNTTTSTTTTSETTSAIQPVSSSEAGKTYGGIALRHQKLPALICQAVSGFGLITIFSVAISLS